MNITRCPWIWHASWFSIYCPLFLWKYNYGLLDWSYILCGLQLLWHSACKACYYSRALFGDAHPCFLKLGSIKQIFRLTEEYDVCNLTAKAIGRRCVLVCNVRLFCRLDSYYCQEEYFRICSLHRSDLHTTLQALFHCYFFWQWSDVCVWLVNIVMEYIGMHLHTSCLSQACYMQLMPAKNPVFLV